MEDPFHTVRKDVEESLQAAETYYKRWQQLLESNGDPEEFDWTTAELRRKLKSIEWDLDDLSDTIKVVEDAPARFKLTPAEITSRKEFIGTVKMKVQDINANLNNPKSKGKAGADKRTALLGARDGKYAKLESEQARQNQQFIDGEDTRQMMIMRQQDDQLEQVGQAVGVLKTMGQVIGTELDEQAQLLDDLDNDVTNANDRLKATIKKIDQVLEISKDPKQTCCICVLLIVLVIMILVYFLG